jgi:hypothetical protein
VHTRDTAVRVRGVSRCAKSKTVPVPALPVLETPRVYPYPWQTLLALAFPNPGPGQSRLEAMTFGPAWPGSEGPLTALDFSSSAAGDPDTHGNGNPSAPQGMSSRLQKPKGEWNRPSKGYSLAKHCSEILGWGMGKFTETEVDHNQLFCMSLLTCFQSASFILWLMIIWITRCLEVHRISRRAVMSAMQYVFLHNYPNIMFSLNVR